MRRLFTAIASCVSFALVLAVIALYATPVARASDHQDSPLTVARPGTDITDVFVFPANDPSKVVLAMDFWPLIPPGLGTQTYVDPGVLYQIKIGNGESQHEDYVVQFKANGAGANQQISVYGPAHPTALGTNNQIVSSALMGTVPYNKATDIGKGVTAFAGPREDPFYFDLAQFFRLEPDRNFANQPNPPANSAVCFRNDAHDFLAGYNVLSLVVEVPRTMLNDRYGKLGRINVWATTSLKTTDSDAATTSPLGSLAAMAKTINTRFGDATDTSGTWTQVERLGRPAIKEAFEAFRNHDATNRSDLRDDSLLAKSIHEYMIHTAGRSEAVASAAVKILIPDAIQADLSAAGPARYLAVETNGKSGLPIPVIRLVPPDGIAGIKHALGNPYRHFGGRDLASPVIDLSLGAIYGSLIPKLGFAPDDHRETPCLASDHTTPAAKHFLPGFPYIGAPR